MSLIDFVLSARLPAQLSPHRGCRCITSQRCGNGAAGAWYESNSAL